MKMWSSYTVECYSAVRNNNVSKFVGKWMDLKKDILDEVTQNQKDKYNMYSLISGF